MVRKIAVIFFIICLDIAFILIIRGDFQPMRDIEVASLEAVSSFESFDTISVEPPLLDEAEPDSMEIQQKDWERATRYSLLPQTLSQAQPARVRTFHAKRLRKRPNLDLYAANEPFEEFKDTIIWYKHAGDERKIERDRMIDVMPTAAYQEDTIPVRRKRSVISKALPIVKKPYDWLKELASELR